MFVAFLFHLLTANVPNDDNITKIFEYVIQHEKYINNEGKNVVIFFGASQKGKSTTINALRNMTFHISDGQLIAGKSEIGEYAAMGDSMSGGMSITRFPQTWPSLIDDWVYVDTSGLFGTSSNPTEDAGNLILLEMAVHKAESVRFVLVDEYHTIMQGAVSFQSIGKIFPGIILNPTQASVLFLYNRFIPPQGVEIPATEPEKTMFIVNRIKRYAKTMCEVQKKEMEDRRTKLIKTIEESANRAGKEGTVDSQTLDIENDPDVQKLKILGSYIPIMESNFDANRVTYFDPMSNYSIEALRQTLKSLEPIQPDQFDFRSTNGDRIEFGFKLAAFLLPLDAIVSALLDLLRLPNSVLKDCKQFIQTRIESQIEDLRLLNDPDAHLIEGKIQKLEEKYHCFENNEDPEVQRLIKRVFDCGCRRKALEDEIKSIKQKTAIIFQSHWNQSGVWWPWSLTNSFEVIYQGSVPYFRVEEILGNETWAIRYHDTPTEFHVIYTSSNFMMMLKKFGSALFQPFVRVYFVVLGYGGDANFPTRTVIGGVRSAFWLPPCSGSVELIAHAMDIPLYQDSVDEKRKELAESMRREQEAVVNLANYKEAGLKQRIIYLINRDRNSLQVFDDVQSFRKVLTQRYKEHEKVIRICSSVLMKLPDHEPPIIAEFRNHWQELQDFQPRTAFNRLTEDEVDSIVQAAEKVLQSGRRNFKTANLDLNWSSR
jgi:energy-coupling factor transporter ATP-binding protein EcfA2